MLDLVNLCQVKNKYLQLDIIRIDFFTKRLLKIIIMKVVLQLFLGVLVISFSINGFSQDLIERSQQGLEQKITTEIIPNNLSKLVAQSKENRQSKSEVLEIFNVALMDKKRHKNMVAGEVVLDIKEQVLISLWKKKASNLILKIPTGEQSSFEIDLVKVNLLSPDFFISDQHGKKVEGIKQSGVFYRGIVKGDVTSIASVCVFKDHINILLGDKEGNYVLEKVDTIKKYRLYNDKKRINKSDWSCGTNDLQEPLWSQNRNSFGTQSAYRSNSDRPIPIFIETDFQMYADLGFNITNLSNYVETIFSHSATLYANEAIPIVISGVRHWNSFDPYFSVFNTSDILEKFGEETKNNFSGRAAHLMSTRDPQGFDGVAWRNGLHASYTGWFVDLDENGVNELHHWGPYGVSTFGSINGIIPILDAALLFTHELGHTIGSPHTQACFWNGDGSPIDGCVPPEQTCERPITFCPSNGGTIMSYCNLLFGCGINLDNGFGDQPGELIRDKYDSFLTCFESPMTLNLIFDDYPEDISWSIRNKNGSILYNGGSYTSAQKGSSIMISNLDLVEGEEYLFVIEDSIGDGICTQNGISCIEPNGLCCTSIGEFHLIDKNGNEVITLPFTTTSSTRFCIGNSSNATCTRPSSVSTINSNDNITLNWNAVFGASTYQIRYRPIGTNTWQNFTDLTNTSYTITEVLQANTSYEWQVRTVCTTGATSDWIGLTFITSATSACTTPSSTSSTNVNGNITLSWNTVSNTSGYQLRYRIQGTNTWSTTFNVGSTTYSPTTGLTANSTYEWQVRSVCNTLVSPWRDAIFTTSNVSGANCTGNFIPVHNSITNGSYIAFTDITASCYINTGGTVTMQAGNSILLTPGFQATLGTDFTAFIAPCSFFRNPNESITTKRKLQETDKDLFIPTQSERLEVLPNPFQSKTTIRFYTPANETAIILVSDLNGQILKKSLVESGSGWNTFLLDAADLGHGMYYVTLQTLDGMVTRKVVVLR